tara:strand:+ start:441 stop:905 length:465 start_codon:yes stop_codon:yes gene_type:complete
VLASVLTLAPRRQSVGAELPKASCAFLSQTANPECNWRWLNRKLLEATEGKPMDEATGKLCTQITTACCTDGDAEEGFKVVRILMNGVVERVVRECGLPEPKSRMGAMMCRLAWPTDAHLLKDPEYPVGEQVVDAGLDGKGTGPLAFHVTTRET